MRKDIMKIFAEFLGQCVRLTWRRGMKPVNFHEANEFAILRKEENEFVFGEDYDEYFFNCSVEGAKEIFRGNIESSDGVNFLFEDADVEFQKTYSYFIAVNGGPAIGPAPVRVRNPELWWSYNKISQRLAGLAADYPELVKIETLGKTVEGRDLQAAVIGRGKAMIGLVGLIHAGESGPELIIPMIENVLRESPALLEKTAILAIPAVCIDQREKLVKGNPWYLRTNSTGVDLNRNFPSHWDEICYSYNMDSTNPQQIIYRGVAPASEPETQAVMAAMDKYPPEAVFIFHALCSFCELPGFMSKYADDEYFSKSREYIKAYASGIYPDKEFDEKWCRKICSSGSLPTWLLERDIPAFDLEANATDIWLPARHDNATPELLYQFQIMHTNALKKSLEYLTNL